MGCDGARTMAIYSTESERDRSEKKRNEDTAFRRFDVLSAAAAAATAEGAKERDERAAKNTK